MGLIQKGLEEVFFLFGGGGGGRVSVGLRGVRGL